MLYYTCIIMLYTNYIQTYIEYKLTSTRYESHIIEM